MHIIIEETHRRIHLHSFGQRPAPRPGGNLQAWPAGTDAWQARVFMDRYFRDAGQLQALRCALTRDGLDGVDVTRCCDEEVRQAAARRVASGTWRITCELSLAPQTLRPVPAQVVSPLLGGRPGVSPVGTSRRPAPAAGRAPASAAAPAPIMTTPDWPDAAAQVAQAATLRRAARDGTPFCEICEAHRRAAAKAAA